MVCVIGKYERGENKEKEKEELEGKGRKDKRGGNRKPTNFDRVEKE